ncbi:DUF1330 domain-containing protein [Capillimicrobium parvum]|uniref:DUF1330 domain-containing protein n=1 Tax=Capillimicrobium parvum TaxID=2884022 RepID=A0A9E6Y1R9_9ACTN|nr:DUF1330 domain-containing protein [Capillimicrobium parvum]UGS38529.1 hypothetical protein DSM104329_04959 [Capillimicrobium parvum]
MPLYALNLFDLADNDDYRAYSRRSLDAVRKYGGTVAAMGALDTDATPTPGDTAPRQVMILVEWPDRAAFDGFLADPGHEDLHPLRENGTDNYLWWAYDKLEDLRPLLKR